MIERVTHGVRHCFRPLFELLPIGGIGARAIAFVHSVGTHSTPFVVVATEPDFGQRTELIVVSHHLWNEVTMIVDDRHFSRMLVVKALRRFGLEQEVIVKELLHNIVLLVYI